MNMQEIRTQARERMKGVCRGCPVCDGRACTGEVPGMGGIGTGRSFRNNVSALEAVRLHMRLIHEVRTPVTETTLLGLSLRMPVLAAPIGGTSFNMGNCLSEQEYATAIVSGCLSGGIVGCTGDGAPAELHECGFEAIRAANGMGIPFLKPWGHAELSDKMIRAAATGCSVLGVDIDAAGLRMPDHMIRPLGPKSPSELASIVEQAHGLGLKFILKGVMTCEDALAAHHAGCDGLVVSNHGGRSFSHTPGTAEVLPSIAARVKGRMAILVDGGVRDGGDVLKMLALGADVVMLGRPFCFAAVGGGAEGVEVFINHLHQQLVQAMLLTGCASVREAGGHLLSLADSRQRS